MDLLSILGAYFGWDLGLDRLWQHHVCRCLVDLPSSSRLDRKQSFLVRYVYVRIAKMAPTIAITTSVMIKGSEFLIIGGGICGNSCEEVI
jgi:hypothetical protein